MLRLALLLLLAAAAPPGGPEVELPRGALADEAALAAAMPALAETAIAIYQQPERARYLNTLFRLQVVAGRHEEAVASIRELVDLRSASGPGAALSLLPFEIDAKARAQVTAGRASYEEAFRREFRAALEPLDGRTAGDAIYWFGASLDRARSDLRAAMERASGHDRIALAQALDLIRRFYFLRAFDALLPLSDSLIAEDDARRYVFRDDILVETRDGAHIAAMAMRPRSTARQPTLLTFTIYADDAQSRSDVRDMAAHGYAGVVAYTRGKGRSPDRIVPYERDGDDARAVIDWIGRQPWSDGRVGMFGGSYNGFTQWAAAKHPPPALKTIVPWVAAIPGLGLPMENNVFLNANYGWAFYVTDNKSLDAEIYSDPERWASMAKRWYASGRPYREIDRIDGVPNPWLQRWLDHPAYDAYWQAMVPYEEDFAEIDIPVLTITGYYDDGQISALRYLTEHVRHDPSADHYLLIGPYDHVGAQRPHKQPVLRGYPIDPVAQFDTPEITFEWMDFVFRGGEKPALLEDKINYEVMGENRWKHAPSLEAMANDTLSLYLTSVEDSKGRYRLSSKRPSEPDQLHQEVDLADRQTSNNDYYPDPIVGKKPDLSNGFAFVSEPFEKPIEIAGAFFGEIRAKINKQDMDIGVVLYELLPNGDLVHLSYYLGRASHAQDMTSRHLLEPGRWESIPFDRTRMVCKRLGQGSRLLVTLNVNKNLYAQVNYGSGKDVSEEDVIDARTPLEIDWSNRSVVRIPVWR